MTFGGVVTAPILILSEMIFEIHPPANPRARTMRTAKGGASQTAWAKNFLKKFKKKSPIFES